MTHIDDFIKRRNANYLEFLKICKNYEDKLILLASSGISAFVLPFLFKSRERKEKFQVIIREGGIESRPLISGNLLRQPFLSKYYSATDYPTADFLHTNAFYVGNNQFVDEKRLSTLACLMDNFFRDSK